MLAREFCVLVQIYLPLVAKTSLGLIPRWVLLGFILNIYKNVKRPKILGAHLLCIFIVELIIFLPGKGCVVSFPVRLVLILTLTPLS